MGQAANSNRRANLDEQKERAAGRADRSPTREAIKDAQSPLEAKGRTGGADGKDGEVDRGPGPTSTAGGGGVRP